MPSTYFVKQVEKVLTAGRYEGTTKRERADYCDAYFKQHSEFEAYCREKRIPLDG